MPRCDQCNKFVSVDSDTDPEMDVNLSDGEISGSIRIVNTCAECSQELAEANFDVSLDVSEAIEQHKKDHPECKDADVTLDDGGATRSDEYVTKDRHGKPIRNPRYQKHLYSVEATFTVTCDQCKSVVATETFADSIQASAMDSLT